MFREERKKIQKNTKKYKKNKKIQEKYKKNTRKIQNFSGLRIRCSEKKEINTKKYKKI